MLRSAVRPCTVRYVPYRQFNCYADVVTVISGHTQIVYVNGQRVNGLYLVHGVATQLLVYLVLFDVTTSGFNSVIILSDNYQLAFAVRSFTVLTWPAQSTAQHER